jgi:predicted cupin superfamily sugar epimerase
MIGFGVEAALLREAAPGRGYYRSAERLPGNRALSTAIYFLLTQDSFSAMHRLASDEIWHFYLGDPVQMLQLPEHGEGRILTLGTDLAAGVRPQVIVPRGTWQGACLLPGGRFALLGATMAPGFDFADFELAQREWLLVAYPQFTELICALTR